MRYFQKYINDRLLAQGNKIIKAVLILLICSTSAHAHGIDLGKITGKVTSGDGKPVPGVSVTIKGSKNGVTTNESGEYSIEASPGDVLIFSSVGFETMEMPVNNKSQVNATLVSSKKALDEVVVVGYGSVRKKDLTGSVISVKSDEIKKVASSNIMDALQGKLGGVDIVTTSGSAGSTPNVTVRGNRSINANNNPLYIVDGIQYDNYQDINPNDIQSMEVLKDASSTAIYGSRGANGVIIITTKKGIAGKINISANTYDGVTQVAGYPTPMTGPEFANLKRQSYRTIGRWNSTADDASIFTPAELAGVNNNTSTYWPGLLLGKGRQQDYGLNVSSGTEKTRVFFSFDYYNEQGLLKNDYYNRYSLHLNIDQTIFSTLKVSIQSQLTYYNQNSRKDNVLTVANKVLPYFNPYNTDGTIAKYPGSGAQENPMFDDVPGAYANQTNTTRVLSMAYAEWKPIKDLTIRSNLGLTNSNSRNGYFEDSNTLDRSLSSGSLSRISNGSSLDLTWENIVTFQKHFHDHSLEVTAVSSYLSNETDSSLAQGTGQLFGNQLFYALQNNPSNIAISSNYIASKLISGAFRINYGYKGKYLLTVTGREDGSSVLSPQNRWAFFPSVAAAWRISDERFMKRQNFFNDLKLRASYGVSGNAAVAPYETQSGLILIPYSWNNQQALAFGLNPQTGNPDLKWELTNNANIGLDFGVLKNRITGSVDVYDSRTHDLLLLRTLPTTSGLSQVLQNIGKTQNDGIEISLRSTNIQTKDVTWTTGFTYTRNKEKIVALVDGTNDVANDWFIGSPVKSFYDYQKIGIWQTADSTLAKSYGYGPGVIRVKDQDNNGVINSTDRKVLGSAVPRYSFGFSNDVRYRDLDLSVYVYARIGQMFVSDYANKFEPNAVENGANVDYWTPENATNAYPRPNANISRASMPFATTLGYEDGSFVKIRNITLGYNVHSSVIRKWHLSNLRIYASAKNYFTFSKIKNYDPEGGGSFDQPLTKLIIVGLNVDL